MSCLYPQFLYMLDSYGSASELINGARTARNITALSNGPGSVFGNPLDYGGCRVLMYDPCSRTAAGVGTSWSATDLTFAGAPWNNGSAAAAEAVGFYIEEWTGLDGAHHTRSATGRGSSRGGAEFGPQSHRHRVMKLNVLILGTTERSVNYLFRWLEQSLLNCCGTCGTQELWVREFCPPDPEHNPDDGLANLDNVALLQGPSWEAPPAENGQCLIRRCSFTLGAGDPCMYRSESGTAATGTALIAGTTLTATPTVAGCGTWLGSSMRTSAILTQPAYGSVAPIVTLTSNPEYRTTGIRKPLPDLRISGFSDPGNIGVSPCTNPRQGELILSGVETSGLTIVVDMARRKITVTDPYTDASAMDGSYLLASRVESFKRWWALESCAYGNVVVEPVYSTLYNNTEKLSDPVSGWSVSVQSVNRWSCC